MSGNPWHRRYHSDALAGMLSLTLEERGAYQTVLDLIYDRGGPVADNERLLAGYMGCSLRKWRALRGALVLKGKLVAADGTLTNARAQKQLETDAKTTRKLAENGAKGGRKKADNAKNDNENNADELAWLEEGSSLPEARSQSIPLPSGNGQEADPSKRFWDSARAYVGPAKSSLIGKLSGQYGRQAVIDALTTAMLASPQPPDRAAYLIGVLKRQRVDAEEVPIV